MLFWQTANTKLENGSRQFLAQFHMVGRQIYEMNVLDDEQSHSEQENLALAVAGLTSLISSTEPGYSSPSPPDSRTPESILTSSQKDVVIGGGRKTRSLNDMSLLLAQGTVEFERGEPLAQPVNVNYCGVYTWILDFENKITKMRFMLEWSVDFHKMCVGGKGMSTILGFKTVQ